MNDAAYKILVAFGDGQGTVHDSMVFSISPRESCDLPPAIVQYAHFAQLFDTIGRWFQAARVVYILTHCTYGVARSWTPEESIP